MGSIFSLLFSLEFNLIEYVLIAICMDSFFILLSARGSYCLSMPERPFCPTDKNKIGSKRCCDYDQLISNDYIPIFT